MAPRVGKRTFRFTASDRDTLLSGIKKGLLVRGLTITKGIYRVSIERLDDGNDEMFNDDERAQLRCLG